MSSVGSSDSNNRSANDEIRRNREEYNKKEAELVKKQTKEVRRLNEQHYAEVERLKDEHQAQISDLHKGTREEISVRDHKYQQDIEGMRDLHRKEIQRMADENQRKEENSRQATETDSNQTKKYNDERFERLNSDYRNKLNEVSQHYDEASRSNREAQHEAIDANRAKLQREHQQQLKILKEERDQSLGSLNREYSDYRDFVNKERQDGEVRHLQDGKRRTEDLMHAVGKERQARQDGEEVLRQGFTSALQDTRDRYEKARKTERDAMNDSESHMKAMAVDRIDNQVRRLEHENRDLKENNVRAQLKSEHEKSLEIKNVRDAFQKNVDNYKEQRDQAIQNANQMNSKDIERVRKELGDQAIDTNRFYRGKMDEQNRIFRQAYDNMKGDYEARHEQQQSTSDERIKHIVSETNDQKSRLIELQNEMHVQGQRQKTDEMKSLRENMEDDKQGAVNRLQEQMRKMEIQHTERMQNTVAKYEKQIQGLKDQMLREKKNNDENTKRLTTELARVHKMEVDQVEAKNREKVRVIGAQHSEEVRALNKRHEEKLDQVLGEIKKT